MEAEREDIQFWEEFARACTSEGSELKEVKEVKHVKEVKEVKEVRHVKEVKEVMMEVKQDKEMMKEVKEDKEMMTQRVAMWKKQVAMWKQQVARPINCEVMRSNSLLRKNWIRKRRKSTYLNIMRKRQRLRSDEEVEECHFQDLMELLDYIGILRRD